jgi:hypothetical protein
MYQLIGPWRLITTFGTVAALLALLHTWIWPIQEVSELWRVASVSVTSAGFLLLIVGQTAIFPSVCRLPFIRDLLPPIDGEWTGTLTSNFPEIARAFRIKSESALEPVVADFTIVARLFEVTISAVSVSPRPGYMRSDTTAFRISRCSQTRRVVIHYVFDATVSSPDRTDVDRFHGAARLTVLGKGGDLTLDGAYWTDRNWQRGQNTAGTLQLRRKLPRPA